MSDKEAADVSDKIMREGTRSTALSRPVAGARYGAAETWKAKKPERILKEPSADSILVHMNGRRTIAWRHQ